MSFQDDRYEPNPYSPPPLPADRGYNQSGFEDDSNRQAQPKYIPPQEEKSGCSRGCLIGMAGCGCLTLILVIIGGYLGFRAVRFLSKSASNDPVKVEATAKELAEFAAPGDLKPVFRFDLHMMKFVVYTSDDNDSQFVLVGINEKALPIGEAQRKEIRRSLDAQIAQERANRDQEEVEIIKSEQKEIQIRGRAVKVMFSEGKQRGGEKKYTVVRGQFEGKLGPVEFELRAPRDKMNEEQAKQFLESLK